MTTTNRAIHYQLSTDQDVERLLGEFAGIASRTVVVAFSQDSNFEPTDLQLASLVAAGKNHGKRLIFEGGSRETAKRAVKLGFDDSAQASDMPNISIRNSSTIAPVIRPRLNEPESLRKFETTDSLATYRPRHIGAKQGLTVKTGDAPSFRHLYQQSGTFHTVSANWTSHNEQDKAGEQSDSEHRESDAPTAVMASPPVPATSRKLTATKPEPEEDADARRQAEPRAARKHGRRRGLILAAAVVAPLVVVAIVAALAVYLLPTAEVSIVAEEESISSSLTYGIAFADASYDIMVDPSPLSSVSTAEATREATGERFEPDGTASGTVRITNPQTSEVTVPAGTEMAGANGVSYFTAEDLVIPAADPFGSLSFGSASVGIYAGIAGPDANLDAGALTGQLGSGLFYTNQEAVSGGTMRGISVITNEDLEAAVAEVEQALVDKAEQEFLSSVPAGFELVPDSIEIGNPEIEVSGEADVDGEQISASGSIEVRGQIFNPDELHERARDQAGRLLASQGGSERVLLVNSVAINEPTALDDNNTAFRIDADATVRKVITSGEEEELVRQLVGLSREDAEALLEDHPKIQRYDILIEPDWLPDRLPEISSRIELHVRSSEQTTANR